MADTGRVFKGLREALTYGDWRKLGWAKDTSRQLADRDHPPDSPRAVVEAFVYCDGDRLAVNRPIETRPPSHSREASATRRDEYAFEWGYNGSGPHAAAKAILGVLLTEEPVPWVSQQFKQDVIAKQPIDGGFTLTEGDVGTWAEWTLANSPPPPTYPQAHDQLVRLAEGGRTVRRNAR